MTSASLTDEHATVGLAMRLRMYTLAEHFENVHHLTRSSSPASSGTVAAPFSWGSTPALGPSRRGAGCRNQVDHP